MPELHIKDGLWFIAGRLVVPANAGVRELIFWLAHDTLGHFDFYKTYESIQNSYFWPNMHKDLESGYIPVLNVSVTKAPPQSPQDHFIHYLCLMNDVNRFQW